jgi:hypothetical protein
MSAKFRLEIRVLQKEANDTAHDRLLAQCANAALITVDVKRRLLRTTCRRALQVTFTQRQWVADVAGARSDAKVIQAGRLGLQFVQLRCRKAALWPTDARLDAIAGGLHYSATAVEDTWLQRKWRPLMCPVVDNPSETAERLKPPQAAPAKQVADKCEPKRPGVYDHPRPLGVYDDMATCG